MHQNTGLAGYRLYRHEIDEPTRTLKLWVRQKGNRVLVCSAVQRCRWRC